MASKGSVRHDENGSMTQNRREVFEAHFKPSERPCFWVDN